MYLSGEAALLNQNRNTMLISGGAVLLVPSIIGAVIGGILGGGKWALAGAVIAPIAVLAIPKNK